MNVQYTIYKFAQQPLDSTHHCFVLPEFQPLPASATVGIKRFESKFLGDGESKGFPGIDVFHVLVIGDALPWLYSFILTFSFTSTSPSSTSTLMSQGPYSLAILRTEKSEIQMLREDSILHGLGSLRPMGLRAVLPWIVAEGGNEVLIKLLQRRL